MASSESMVGEWHAGKAFLFFLCAVILGTLFVVAGNEAAQRYRRKKAIANGTWRGRWMAGNAAAMPGNTGIAGPTPTPVVVAPIGGGGAAPAVLPAIIPQVIPGVDTPGTIVDPANGFMSANGTGMAFG